MFPSFYATVKPLSRIILEVDNLFSAWHKRIMANQEKEKTEEYLTKHGITPSKLADEAGVGRWSVCRWLQQEDADIVMSTWEKLSRFMAMNP